MNIPKRVILHKTASVNYSGSNAWFIVKMVLVVGAMVLIGMYVQFGPAQEPPSPLHDYGRMFIVFDQFCDGHADNPTPLRCARVVWCWTHQQKEAQDWPLAEAIPFLKELEEASTW